MSTTHTSTEQPEINELCQWFNEGDGFKQGTAAPHKWVLQANSEISRQHARIAELEAELEAAQAQRVPLSEVMNLVSEWGMASHANGEAALDAHNPDATPDEIAYADECVQSERAAWKAIEDKLRALEHNHEMLKVLLKVQEDVNWMTNSNKLLNRFVFNYVDETIAKIEDAKTT